MSTQLKLRRGTTAQHSTFTGASGEVTVDTDKKVIVVHDGATAGGYPMLNAGMTSNRPSIRPSLLLDFSNTKQLDPRITFSRPTTATYYEGKTVVKAEENLLQYSEQFDVAPWNLGRTTLVTNSTNSPTGTLTADKLVLDNTAANTHYVSQIFTTVDGAYTYSIYAKSGELNWLFLATAYPSGAYYDLTNGVLGTVSGGHTATITAVGNGWYRCTLTSTLTAGSKNAFAILAQSNGTVTFNGDGTSGIYIWGAQLEQRSTVTAYTPTTTAPITNYIPALQTAAANVARFDHDPVTGESKGLLIEEQRTNLLTYSEQFDNAVWLKAAAGTGTCSVVANQGIAPDGNITADQVMFSATSGSEAFIQQTFTAVTSTIYTSSVYIKALTQADVGKILLLRHAGSATYTTITLSTSWQRIGSTETAVSTQPAFELGLRPAIGGSSGAVNVLVWGAQLEAGAFPTSYIPTVASQVTRSADSASMTGSNFSSWYRQDEGTLYAESVSVSGGQQVILLSDSANSIQIYQTSSTQAGGYIRRNAIFEASMLSNSSQNTNAKLTIGYKTNDSVFVANGGTPVIDTSVSLPVPVLMRIGVGADGMTSFINGTIKRLAYYPKRLSNTELQGLTS